MQNQRRLDGRMLQYVNQAIGTIPGREDGHEPSVRQARTARKQ